MLIFKTFAHWDLFKPFIEETALSTISQTEKRCSELGLVEGQLPPGWRLLCWTHLSPTQGPHDVILGWVLPHSNPQCSHLKKGFVNRPISQVVVRIKRETSKKVCLVH